MLCCWLLWAERLRSRRLRTVTQAIQRYCLLIPAVGHSPIPLHVLMAVLRNQFFSALSLSFPPVLLKQQQQANKERLHTHTHTHTPSPSKARLTASVLKQDPSTQMVKKRFNIKAINNKKNANKTMINKIRVLIRLRFVECLESLEESNKRHLFK